MDADLASILTWSPHVLMDPVLIAISSEPACDIFPPLSLQPAGWPWWSDRGRKQLVRIVEVEESCTLLFHDRVGALLRARGCVRPSKSSTTREEARPCARSHTSSRDSELFMAPRRERAVESGWV